MITIIIIILFRFHFYICVKNFLNVSFPKRFNMLLLLNVTYKVITRNERYIKSE